MHQRRSRSQTPSRFLNRYRPSCEPLEDRTTPTVTAVQDPSSHLVTVTLGAIGDSATITGTDSSGTTVAVADNLANTTQAFTNLSGISVVDGGNNAGQSVTFNDQGAGTKIAVTGEILTSGIESVDITTADAPLQADSIDISGASTSIRLDANTVTTGPSGQIFDGPVTLGNLTVTVNAGSAGGILFDQAVNSSAAGDTDLVLNAGSITTFKGILGGVAPLASLTTDALGTTMIGANVVTTGAQAFNDPSVLIGSTVTLTSTGSGNVTFADKLDASTSGANSLVVNTAGITTFSKVVGGSIALGGIATDSAGSTRIQANVSTLGAQTYSDPVTLSGAAITLATATSAGISFNNTLDDDAAGATALTINSPTGGTTFGGSVGSGLPLASLTTDAGTGGTVFGSNSAATYTVVTTGAQTFGDAVRLNGASLTFRSTQNGNITFGNTLNGTVTVLTDTVLDTGGVTTFTGAVGGLTPLHSLMTDSVAQALNNEQTVIQASVTTQADQTYADSVTFTPATGVSSQTVTSSGGTITFQKTLGGAAAAAVTIRAGTNVAFNADASFTASGSRLNVQAGSSGTGAITIASGLTFKADTLTWQAGDGAGGSTAATVDLVTNSPSLRDSTGTTAPKNFALRQDAAVLDSSLPTLGQFGGAPPVNYEIISDDSSLTLNSTTALAGAGTTNLALSGSQAVTLGATINAPVGIVRIRSVNAGVTQTGGGITASGLGVRSGLGIALTGTNLVKGPFAASSPSSGLQFANGAPYTIGTIGSDPLNLVFTTLTGVSGGTGAVTLAQAGSSPLDVTIAAAVTGASVTATGGAGADKVTVNYIIGGSLANGLSFNGNGGSDSLVLSDAGSSTAHTYALGSSATRDSNATINYSGVESVTVTGGSAGDTFNVTPDATAAFTTTGGLPTGTTGDKLTIALAGTTTPSLSTSKASDGLQGSATFGNRATISFSQMETLSPQADLQVSSSVSKAFVQTGGSTTITVTVKNAGPDPVTGATINSALFPSPGNLLGNNVFPPGISATWTATASTGSSVGAASGSGDIHTTANLIANGTATFTITVTANSGFTGSVTNTLSASAATTAFDPNPSDNSASSSFTVVPLSLIAVGAGAGGGPQVKVFNADGSLRFNFFAYEPSYFGGVTVATGDVNGDGIEDIITGSATGSSHIKVFDGATGGEIASFFAFPGFGGGVSVAVADGQVIAGAGPGGGPAIAGFRIAGGLTPTFSLFAFDPSFSGGVFVAGNDHLITASPGPTGGPIVKVFDAATLNPVSTFFTYAPSDTSGIPIAMGTFGGRDTVIAGNGAGQLPTVVSFDAQTGNQVSTVLAYDASFTGGVRVAAATTASGQAATVMGTGPGGAPRVRVVAADGTSALDFFAFDPSFTGGIYVG